MGEGARRSWVALLPASKGTAVGGDGPAWRQVCGRHGRQVAEALAEAAATLGDDDFARLTQTPSTRVDAVRRENGAVVDAATMPAWERYTGVVHAAADAGSLDSVARRRFRRHVAYVSALGGLVHADDPLPAYRLPMGANLHGVGPLASFWRDRIEQALAEHLAPGARVWLLTGAEYERAIAIPVGLRRVDVEFVERRKGRDASPPSAAVKQARGIIARQLAMEPDLARTPAGPDWHAVSFEAGLRTFDLDHADDDRQVWRATPA